MSANGVITPAHGFLDGNQFREWTFEGVLDEHTLCLKVDFISGHTFPSGGRVKITFKTPPESSVPMIELWPIGFTRSPETTVIDVGHIGTLAENQGAIFNIGTIFKRVILFAIFNDNSDGRLLHFGVSTFLRSHGRLLIPFELRTEPGFNPSLFDAASEERERTRRNSI